MDIIRLVGTAVREFLYRLRNAIVKLWQFIMKHLIEIIPYGVLVLLLLNRKWTYRDLLVVTLIIAATQVVSMLYRNILLKIETVDGIPLPPRKLTKYDASIEEISLDPSNLPEALVYLHEMEEYLIKRGYLK